MVLNPTGKSWHRAIVDRSEIVALGDGKDTPIIRIPVIFLYQILNDRVIDLNHKKPPTQKPDFLN